jgi:hypothetical protein
MLVKNPNNIGFGALVCDALDRVGQHSTGHNQQPDQLCEGDVSRRMRQMILTGFLIQALTFFLRYL